MSTDMSTEFCGLPGRTNDLRDGGGHGTCVIGIVEMDDDPSGSRRFNNNHMFALRSGFVAASVDQLTALWARKQLDLAAAP